MTKREAMQAIHKQRCRRVDCIHCEYLATVCENPEIMEIVKVLNLSPVLFKLENVPEFGLCKVGYFSDHSGILILPEDYKTKPEGDEPEEIIGYLTDIGLLDEVAE